MDRERIERLKQLLEYIIKMANSGLGHQRLSCDAEDAAWLLATIKVWENQNCV